MKECGAAIKRAFDFANTSISKGKEFWDCGTCSFFGGIIVQIKEEGEAMNYALIALNVGNIKAYVWTPQNNCILINEFSTIDANLGTDICGRIGPYNRDGTSDLKNLEKYMVILKENDILFFLSSGLDLNFDPREIGQTPKDCSIDSNFLSTNNISIESENKEISWSVLNCKDPKIYQKINEKKIENISKKLHKISSLSHNSLSLIPSVLTLHASQLTQNARNHMESNPLNR